MTSQKHDWRYQRAQEHFQESIAVKQKALETCLDSALAGAELIFQAFQSGGKLLLCGNGGSAADAQHMAAEFTSRLTLDFERPGLPALALTTDTSFLTAYANDFEFEGVFARQVQALGKPGDVLLGISTSGNSKNVVRAVEEAHTQQMKTISLIGNAGRLKTLATVAICVPTQKTQYIQETHLAIEHILCDLVERMMFKDKL